MPGWLLQNTRRVWAVLNLAVKKFLRIYGAQWAGAFAFNAFFSFFPLIVLFVTIASAFIDRDRAGKEIIAYVESYIPINGEMQGTIFNTITGVINAHGQGILSEAGGAKRFVFFPRSTSYLGIRSPRNWKKRFKMWIQV